MVKVIEIFDDADSDDEDVIVFDHTPCGKSLNAELLNKEEFKFTVRKHRWRTW